MANFLYPRTFRVTYAKNPTPQFQVTTEHDHFQPVAPSETETVDIDCHCTRVDGYFYHFAIIKRYDQERDTPVWIYRRSIPLGLIRNVELIRDDSDHAVPMDAVDLDKLIPAGTAE